MVDDRLGFSERKTDWERCPQKRNITLGKFSGELYQRVKKEKDSQFLLEEFM